MTGRRALLAASLAAGGLAGRARRAAAAEQARLLVAGPAGGPLCALAGALRPALLRAIGGAATLETHAVGGADGVTGANQFQAWFESEADGTALLLLPGAATAAWLAGDPRVHFDVARWLPLLCGVGGGVLASRRPLADARPGAPLRLAVPHRFGPAAACLLGLDLLGVPAEARAAVDGAAALAAGHVDAAFLRGPELLEAGAAVPIGSLDVTGQADEAAPPHLADLLAREESRTAMPPLLPSVPPPSAPALLRAVGAAALLDHALVLTAPASAPALALWREAAERAAADASLHAALPAGVRPVVAPECVAVQAAIAVDAAALLAYRSWLADRFG